MISTKDLSALPDIVSFRRLTRALATLDAILSPDWNGRYYSFNSQWGEGEMMASMRNGSGDEWHALLCSAGIALRGLAHEAPFFRMRESRPGIFESLPTQFHANFLNEPAFDAKNSTFCIWRLVSDERWHCGPVQLPDGLDPDGSAELLAIFDGRPQQYVDFANDYYEQQVDLADVTSIYLHEALTEALVSRLNPEIDIKSLTKDIREIGYPDVR